MSDRSLLLRSIALEDGPARAAIDDHNHGSLTPTASVIGLKGRDEREEDRQTLSGDLQSKATIGARREHAAAGIEIGFEVLM